MAEGFRLVPKQEKDGSVSIEVVRSVTDGEARLEMKIIPEGTECLDAKTGQMQRLTSSVLCEVREGIATPAYNWDVDGD